LAKRIDIDVEPAHNIGDDLDPPHVLVWRAAMRDSRLEPLAIRSRDTVGER
jgi:hypothetical protein